MDSSSETRLNVNDCSGFSYTYYDIYIYQLIKYIIVTLVGLVKYLF